MSGARADPEIKLLDNQNIPLNFDNLRSQMIYLYARGIELGIIHHLAGLPYLNELQKEAMGHHHDVTDKVLLRALELDPLGGHKVAGRVLVRQLAAGVLSQDYSGVHRVVPTEP